MNLLWFPHRQSRKSILGLPLLLVWTWAVALYAQQSGTAIVFYAQPQVSEEMWPSLFQVVRADLASGDGELANGVALDKAPILVRGNEDLRGVTFSHVISVKLLGRCDLLPQAYRPDVTGPLGWVLLVSGKIQPYVSIDCNRLAQVLRPTLASLNKEDRRYAMLQAIAHVLIHEWIHIATQSDVHGRQGIMQAYLSANQLIAGPKSGDLPTWLPCTTLLKIVTPLAPSWPTANFPH
jgi:hypothetical protein